ncbi:hypothetical protein ACSBJY_005214 [Klebsiella pneumoniae]|uniref:hypothetical protein n=1 Tax=Klebsiella TaxID=570 RepID=UPI000B950A26|nr:MULTISPECIES: hypothetical protein [Klebsiella]MEC5393219.1 hypothetical protein [Klebsiella pneumoniae]OYJ05608.1 hypothetical protein CI741_01515 [Klebsiella pneumoniae subsp. pneumoniae]HBW8673380.1 hypothetical protein [Klebsiella pneumoniae]HBW8706580.1 hypothetical protein [Klebsiella pneumoniae]HBX3205540.1 hypothetical protein [Klebsiella pneumoniae]
MTLCCFCAQRNLRLSNLEHLPPELKQVALQIVQNQFDRDTAEKKLAELIQQLEFDITAAELSAYLFKPGHA